MEQFRKRASIVATMTTLWEGRSGVRFPVGTRDALFSKTFRLALTCNPVSYSVVVWSTSSSGNAAIY